MTMGRLRTSKLELTTCTVAACESPAPGYALLSLRPPVPVEARPGQFAMIEVSSAMLHRPMSILAAGETLEFLIREVGTGSRALASLREGDRVRVIAPLGNSFPPPTPGVCDVLVGGGVGASPLVMHAAASARANRRPTMVYGGRTSVDLLLSAEAAAACDLVAVTEDGSRGIRGLATDPLAGLLGGAGPSRVLTCGPLPMMAATARVCAAMQIECLACLEAMMACGFGACLGCAVPARDSRILCVCSDGPVVDATEVDWEVLSAPT
jgi:dihydroorotate dehydrogenase electron transfer subunit